MRNASPNNEWRLNMSNDRIKQAMKSTIHAVSERGP